MERGVTLRPISSGTRKNDGVEKEARAIARRGVFDLDEANPGGHVSLVNCSQRGAVLVSILVCDCASPRSPGESAFAVPPAEAQANLAYEEMAVAAANQLRLATPGKSIGMYRSTGTSSTLRDLVNGVMEAYDFREVKPGEARVQCAARARNVRAPVMPSCTIDVADVILQMNSVQISNDSGFVGGLRTEVPTGSDKMRTTAFCLIAVRQHDEWQGVRYLAVNSPHDCTSQGKH